MAYQNQICMNKNTSRRKRINKTTIIFPHPIVHNLFQKNFYLYNCLVCLFFFTLFISVSIESQNYKCGLASFSISGSFCIWNCTEMLSSYNKKRKVIDYFNGIRKTLHKNKKITNKQIKSMYLQWKEQRSELALKAASFRSLWLHVCQSKFGT